MQFIWRCSRNAFIYVSGSFLPRDNASAVYAVVVCLSLYQNS